MLLAHFWEHLLRFWHDCFDWPSGVVVGNLLASFLWVPIQWLGIRARLAAHHAEVHAHLDQQDADIIARFKKQDEVLAEIRDFIRRSGPGLLTNDETP